MVTAALIDAALLRGDPDVTEDDWLQIVVEERERRERAEDGLDALRVYSLPREGTPAQVAAGLEEAEILAGHVAADPRERGT